MRETFLVKTACNERRAFVTRRIARETLVIPVVDGIADLGSIHALNEVASFIWQLCNAPISIGQIAAQVAAHYEVDPERALQDVESLTDQLAERGLICISRQTDV
jgi:hypothetical protein